MISIWNEQRTQDILPCHFGPSTAKSISKHHRYFSRKKIQCKLHQKYSEHMNAVFKEQATMKSTKPEIIYMAFDQNPSDGCFHA